jgi:hypothetical protein
VEEISNLKCLIGESKRKKEGKFMRASYYKRWKKLSMDEKKRLVEGWNTEDHKIS